MVRVRPIPLWGWRLLLPVAFLSTVPIQAPAQSNADRRQELEIALDKYADAKTAGQRAAVVEYLQHIDPKIVAPAAVDHIISARTGTEATDYSTLAASFEPEGCSAILDRLAIAQDPAAKGKLIVALRHCHQEQAVSALVGCLDDGRLMTFTTHGPFPHRICDLAYDELFLKLRTDPRYALDSSPHMHGFITVKTPIKTRTSLIAKLKAKLASSSPSAAPSTPKPATPAPAL